MRNRIRGFSEGSQLTKTSRRNQLTVEVDFSRRIPGVGCLRYPNERDSILHGTLASAGPSNFNCIVEIWPLSLTSKFAISHTRVPSSPQEGVPGNCTNTRLELELKITEAISNNGENSTMLISHGTVTKIVAWAGWDGVSWPVPASKLGTSCNPAGANECELFATGLCCSEGSIRRVPNVAPTG